MIFENIVPSLLNMCLDDVCYLILTELHTNQYRDLIDKKSHLRPIYLSCSLLRVYTKSCEEFKLTNMSLPIIERYDNWMRQFLILSDLIRSYGQGYLWGWRCPQYGHIQTFPAFRVCAVHLCLFTFVGHL